MSFDSDIDVPRLVALRKRYQSGLDKAIANTADENSKQWIEFNRNRLNELPMQSCLNCIHRGSGNICTLVGIVPPPEIQDVGCESWMFDDIPF